MRLINLKIILLSVAFGTFIWILDSFIDYYFFYNNQYTFTELFITDIPGHILFMRITVTVLFILFALILIGNLNELRKSKSTLRNILHNVIPISITDKNFNIIATNESYDTIFGKVDRRKNTIKCHEERPGPKCFSDECPHVQVFSKGKEIVSIETVTKDENSKEHHFIVTATPYRNFEGKKTGIIETFQNITPRKKLEKEKENLIDSLRVALEEVKILSGFLPICASCKKIRDDKGYWTQIETYIREHSDAEFSHGICPDCAEKHYGEFHNNSLEK